MIQIHERSISVFSQEAAQSGTNGKMGGGKISHEERRRRMDRTTLELHQGKRLEDISKSGGWSSVEHVVGARRSTVTNVLVKDHISRKGNRQKLQQR